MAIVLEDGSGVADANSYAEVTTADAYHSARGNATWTEASTSPDQGKTAALVRATAAIDAAYRMRFPGVRTNGRDQALEWPRAYAITDASDPDSIGNITDAEGWEIDTDEIPQEIIDAVCEAALRELIEPGSMMPDLVRGGWIKRLKAGSVEIEYGSNATPETVYSLIDGILAKLLGGNSNPYTARAVRG